MRKHGFEGFRAVTMRRATCGKVDAKEPLALGLRAASGGALAAEIWNGDSLGQRRSPKGVLNGDRVVEGWSSNYRAAGMGGVRGV